MAGRAAREGGVNARHEARPIRQRRSRRRPSAPPAWMCARLDDAPTNVALLKQPLSRDLIKPVDHTRLREHPLAPNLKRICRRSRFGRGGTYESGYVMELRR